MQKRGALPSEDMMGVVGYNQQIYIYIRFNTVYYNIILYHIISNYTTLYYILLYYIIL